MAKHAEVGEVEAEILRFVAARDGASVGEAAEHFAAAGKARTTVGTLLERLRGKRLVRRKKVAGVFRYWPAIDAAELGHQMVGKLVDGVLGGSVAPLVAFLAASEKLTPADVAKLRDLVDALEDRP